MTFLRTDHVGFTVAELDRSIAWYTLFLRVPPVLVRRGWDRPYTGEMIGYAGAEISWAYFELPGGAHLELIEYTTPEPRPGSTETNTLGSAHLCLLVTDIHAEYERLSGAAQFRSPAPVRIPEGPNEGGWGLYLRDPDGITVELIQPRPALLRTMTGGSP